MNKAMLETRKKMFEEKMNDKSYLETSYKRQKEVQKKLKENDPSKTIS